MASFRFGDFELSEEGRQLRHCGAEIALQPRVFDLLAYLLRHHHRVVTKDELMNALWPDVTVTEASLQRLVSLARNALRGGDMENAIRSFSRIGYGFAKTVDTAAAAGPNHCDPVPGSRTDAVGDARALFGQRRWKEAAEAFDRADQASSSSTDDLALWAQALERGGAPDKALEILRRAAIAHDAAGDHRAVAGVAMTISRIHLERNEAAAAKGWHSRAARLLGDETNTREYGLLCWNEARIAAAECEPERALALSSQAYETGRSIGDTEVEALGLIYRGFYKLCLGRTREGQDDQDHAAALALSSGVDPMTGCTIYCNILWACRNFGDWERANQWTLGYQKWCRECGILNFTGSCRLHRAELLSVRGTLDQAEHLIVEALASLVTDAPWATGDAYRVLGDICRVRGESDRAEQAYENAAAAGWDPQPGLALLQQEKGEGTAALSGLERAMVGRSWSTLQRQGILMAYLALIAARNGLDQRARDVVKALEDAPDRWSTPSIRAVVAEAKAELFARENRPAAAVEELEIARRLWSTVGAAYNAAEVRLGIAELLIRQGNRAGAAMEVKAARFVAERLGATKLVHRCDELDLALGTG